MSNKEIAYAFDELANLLELHDDNEFKIKSYRNAYLTLRKMEQPLSALSEADLKGIKGIGPAISGKIRELIDTGHMKALDEALAKTPPGVTEMLQVNGFGPKKVRVVWHEMGIESIGELWYACNENRLVEYKGFGLKTQTDLREKLEYYLRSKDKWHLDAALRQANNIADTLCKQLPDTAIQIVGEVRRACPVVDTIEILLAFEGDLSPTLSAAGWTIAPPQSNQSDLIGSIKIQLPDQTEAILHTCAPADFGSKMLRHTGPTAFLERLAQAAPGQDFRHLPDEQAVFAKAGLPYVAPEVRDSPNALDHVRQKGGMPKLIEQNDLRGVLHVHTTWSDGLHSLEDMCQYAQSLGYEYIGITDHSQSAFYANGLKPDRVLAQMAEIDALNVKMAPFRILKGIESDILSDGRLDYEDALLERFDFVIASVHSNLKMSQEKATERVLAAIANPFTTILGHPTGRLLLSRAGYPLDWPRILDACARHNVAIELNAHPYRLDIDYTLIPDALERGIKISINPDAHSKEGLHDVQYGIAVARKGWLTAEGCLNAARWGG
jgi:DNA polymerase (family X)